VNLRPDSREPQTSDKMHVPNGGFVFMPKDIPLIKHVYLVSLMENQAV
jgi:hypothetical protein